MIGLHWSKTHLAKNVVEFTMLVLILQNLEMVFYLVLVSSESDGNHAS